MKCGSPISYPLYPNTSHVYGYSFVQEYIEPSMYATSKVHLGKSWFPLENGTSVLVEEPPLTIVVQSEYEPDSYGPDSEPMELADSFYNAYSGTYWLAYEDLTFSATHLKEYGDCQPLSYYQWGFSSLLLFTFCILTLLFSSIYTSNRGVSSVS